MRQIATTEDQTSCHPQQVATTASTSESGASIERVVAFDPRDWTEATVSTPRPTFLPPAGVEGAVHLRLVMLDDPQPKLIWEGTVSSLPAEYPASAPSLQTGLPYRVELVGADGKTHAETFSIDPGYLSESGRSATAVEVSP